MSEMEYIPAEADPIPEDVVIVTCWVRTADGALLFGGTYRRGPFDGLSDLQAELLQRIPWERVSPPTILRRQVIQLQLDF